jgi:hypothetical protein
VFEFGGRPCLVDLEGGGGGSRRTDGGDCSADGGGEVAPPDGRNRTGGGPVTGSGAMRQDWLGRAGSRGAGSRRPGRWWEEAAAGKEA